MYLVLVNCLVISTRSIFVCVCLKLIRSRYRVRNPFLCWIIWIKKIIYYESLALRRWFVIRDSEHCSIWALLLKFVRLKRFKVISSDYTSYLLFAYLPNNIVSNVPIRRRTQLPKNVYQTVSIHTCIQLVYNYSTKKMFPGFIKLIIVRWSWYFTKESTQLTISINYVSWKKFVRYCVDQLIFSENTCDSRKKNVCL